MNRETILVAAPYLVWMALMTLLPSDALSYAVRSAVSAAVLVVTAAVLRPRLPSWRALVWGGAVGLAVYALWTYPESLAWYRRLFVIGADEPVTGQAACDPAVCGWPLTWARLAGSAFVIAPAEELFFRHFLYRRLQSHDWRSVDCRVFDLSAFLWTVGLFALEHNRWLAGAMAGAAYGVVAMRKGIWSAIVAHVVTNLVLGLHVIRCGAWAFW